MPTLSYPVRFALLASLVASAAACEGESSDGFVDERGGVVESDDGRLILEVPAGALDHGVRVSIHTTDATLPDAVGPTYELLPVGTAFRLPARLSYDLSDLDMVGLDEESVALVVEKQDTWFYLADQAKEDGVISASALYLSAFTVVATPEDDDGGHGSDHDHDG